MLTNNTTDNVKKNLVILMPADMSVDDTTSDAALLRPGTQ